MKTLLVLTSTYPRWKNDPEPGFVHELSARLTKHFRVIVLGPHAPGAVSREVLDGVEIVRYRYAPQRWETLVNDGGIVTNLKLRRWKLLLVPSFILMQGWWAWRLCRREKVDAVHAHWLVPQGWLAAMLQRLPGRKIPFVATSHGADLYALKGRAFDKLKRYVLDQAAAVTVVSSAMRDAIQTLGADLERVSVQPMGVDMTRRFIPDDGVQRQPRELLFVGRLVEKKGLRHLLDALPQVLCRYPDVTLTVGGFGPEEQALKAQVSGLGLDSHVRFIGAVPQADLPTLYRRATLFVAPFVRASSGDEEGLGLVLVEAVACACPILAGNVPALSQVLGDEFDEMRADPMDQANMVEKICAVLQDPAIAQARAATLRQALLVRFDWTEVAAEYARAIAGVIHERGEPSAS